MRVGLWVGGGPAGERGSRPQGGRGRSAGGDLAVGRYGPLPSDLAALEVEVTPLEPTGLAEAEACAAQEEEERIEAGDPLFGGGPRTREPPPPRSNNPSPPPRPAPPCATPRPVAGPLFSPTPPTPTHPHPPPP